MKLVFDTESNGFVEEATCIHCIVDIEVESKHISQYTSANSDICRGIQRLAQATELVGHNIISHDIPLIHKLYPDVVFNPDLLIFDTMIFSQLLTPERQGGHSLENFGKIFNRHKPQHEDWSQFSPEMLHRCVEDTEINLLTYNYLLKEAWEDVQGIPYSDIWMSLI